MKMFGRGGGREEGGGVHRATSQVVCPADHPARQVLDPGVPQALPVRHRQNRGQHRHKSKRASGPQQDQAQPNEPPPQEPRRLQRGPEKGGGAQQGEGQHAEQQTRDDHRVGAAEQCIILTVGDCKFRNQGFNNRARLSPVSQQSASGLKGEGRGGGSTVSRRAWQSSRPPKILFSKGCTSKRYSALLPPIAAYQKSQILRAIS